MSPRDINDQHIIEFLPCHPPCHRPSSLIEVIPPIHSLAAHREPHSFRPVLAGNGSSSEFSFAGRFRLDFTLGRGVQRFSGILSPNESVESTLPILIAR